MQQQVYLLRHACVIHASCEQQAWPGQAAKRLQDLFGLPAIKKRLDLGVLVWQTSCCLVQRKLCHQRQVVR